MSAVTILLIVALLCWFFGALPLPWTSLVNLVALGLFFYGLAQLVGH